MKKSEKIHKKAQEKFSWRLLGENFVFEHKGHFYKMPTFLARNIVYRKIDSKKKIEASFLLIKEYFGALTKTPQTEFIQDKNGHYIIKQKKIQGEKLSKKLLKENPKLLSKFQRLIIANEIMWLKEGVFLDLLGSDIVTQPNTIHNLLTDGVHIYVFDFGLLEKRSKNTFFRYFSHFAAWFQLQFIKRFF